MVAVAIVVVEGIVQARTIGHEQVDEPVIIVIAPGTTDGIPGVRSDVAGEHSAECSIAVVLIQKVLLAGSISHTQVKISIVVVIAPRASQRHASVGPDP